MSLRFHVNIDHVATVRNARGTRYPDPLLAAQSCELAGADGITAHLREDRRHMVDDDIVRLRAALQVPLNLEMAATDEMIAIAERTKPAVITLVPERREERTTEGGLDVRATARSLQAAIGMATKAGIKASLFIAPAIADVEAAAELGAQQIELHTGEFCHVCHTPAGPAELERLRAATRRGLELGLEVAAGHGLSRHNLGPVVAIEGIVEVNIGHAVIADAIFMGLEGAVRAFREALDRAEVDRAEPGRPDAARPCG